MPQYHHASYVDPWRTQPEKCQDSGCMFAMRVIEDEGRKYKIDAKGKISLGRGPSEDGYDDMDDGDWVESDDGEKDDPLEYISDDEAEVELHENDIEMTDSDDNPDESMTREQLRKFWSEAILESHQGRWVNTEFLRRLTEVNDKYPAWYSGKPYHIEVGAKDDVVDKMFPLYNPEHSIPFRPAKMTLRPRKGTGAERALPDLSDRKLLESRLAYNIKDPGKIEHIAGPECNNINGYSGHEISADEMRGCQTLQCLVRKPKGYIFDALPDDEEFETTGEFFLSGLGDHMPSRDSNSPLVTPARHGCERPSAENCMWSRDEALDFAMPFHPTCLEIYKRLSTLSLGKVDINVLTSWWSLEADFNLFHEMQSSHRDPNVRKCNDQNWTHWKGTEYLVANPVYIPQLRDIFATAVDTAPDFSPRNGAFNILESMEERTGVDMFERLPVELRTEVLDNLSSKDIASLRLASRVFSQLPVSYFQNLLKRECPWLWEAWPTRLKPEQGLYPKWAFMSASEVTEMTERQAKDFAILDSYCQMVKQDIPESAPEVDAAYEAQFLAIQDAHRLQNDTEDSKPFYLPPTRTNYFTLYTLITRHWKQLRGLQNRKRIWKDCEEILRRVAVYKEEGRIGDDGVITENLWDIVDKNDNRVRV
jgi:hypothetical protein